MTCSEVFERMNDKFKEYNMKDVHGVFQFEIEGNGGGRWHAICQGDHCQVGRGLTERPDVVVYANAKNVVKLAEGRLNPLLALATRKIKVKGDWNLINKMKNFFG